MKHILLLGGAGYVGTVLSQVFLERGYKITVLDNFIYDNQFSIVSYLGDTNYRLIKGDMGNKKDLDNASQGITDVIILAGLVGDPITKKYPEESDAINVKGVQFAIDYFENKDIDKLVFISTCSNYGLIKEDELADENFELNPLSLYAKAKVENEKYVLSKKDTAKYTGVILRFATAFGLSPRMRFDLSVSEFVKDLYEGNELLVYDENTWRPYCHVRDFANLLEIVLNAAKEKVNFEVFNAGGSVNNSTKKMIVDKILKYIPSGEVKYVENGSDPRNYKVNFDKVKSVLGFEPKYTIDHGIEELINAFQMGVFSDSSTDKDKYGNYTLST